jgi:hypothetical protein
LVRSNYLCGFIDDEDRQWVLDAGGDPHLVLRNRKSRFGWGAGFFFCFCLLQMFQNLGNHLMVGNEGNDAERSSTIAFQRLCLIHSLDEPGPVFSESGALFWRELEFVFGCVSLIGSERLKDEATFVPVSPRFGRVGSENTSPRVPWALESV